METLLHRRRDRHTPKSIIFVGVMVLLAMLLAACGTVGLLQVVEHQLLMPCHVAVRQTIAARRLRQLHLYPHLSLPLI